MTIKEIENKTGLTAKSIRYYESKGLLAVERQTDNNYREYSEENLLALKKIKLYRYLDFSIEEIKDILSSDDSAVLDILEKKQNYFDEHSELLEEKQKLLKNLSKDIKNKKDFVDSYIEELNFWETEAGEDLRTTLRDFVTPSLGMCILSTLLLCGPIISLFFHLARGIADGMIQYAILSIFATVWLTVIWTNYFSSSKYTREKIKERNKRHSKENRKDLKYEILAVLSGFAVLFGVMMFSEHILAPEGGLFYVTDDSAMVFLAALTGATAIMTAILFSLRKESGRIPRVMRVVTLCLVIFWIILLYCSATTVTYFTEEKIIVHTPLNPSGTEYGYEDVSKINAGFGTKNISIHEYERKGNFGYKITLDGHEFNLSLSTIGSREGDTYELLENFDKRLVELGIEKEIGSREHERCTLEQEYIDVLLRILDNK